MVVTLTPKNNQDPETGPTGRRKFLSRAVACGIAGAFGAARVEAGASGQKEGEAQQGQLDDPSATPLAEVCSVPASAADALERQQYLLLMAQYEATNKLVDRYRGLSQRCGDVLLSLRTQVKKLEDLLRSKSRSGAQERTRQMRALVSLGQSQVNLLKTSASPDTAALAATLEVVTNGVKQNAEGLLPKGPPTLDDDVLKQVNEILNTIRTSETLQQVLTAEQAKADADRASFNDLMQPLLSHVKEAASQVLLAEVPSDVEILGNQISRNDRAGARRKAIDELRAALNKMGDLKKNGLVNGETRDIIELAEFLLDGTYIWIQVEGGIKPRSTRKAGDTARRPAGASFLRAGYSEPAQLLPQPRVIERRKISGMLWRHCVRGTEWAVAELVASALKSTVYSVWFWSKISPYTYPQILNEVRRALNRMNLKCDSSDPNFRPDREALANALTGYIIQRYGV